MVEAVVEYDYIAQEPDELTIHKGDVIRNIIQKKGGWWEGTLRDKRGMFPDNFVTVIQKESKLRPKPNRIRQCRAIFSYHPAHDDELNLAAGDIIDIVCEVEEGWWKGRLGSLEGVFPSNFVHEIDPDKPQSKSNSKEDLTNLAGENDSASPSLPPKPTRIVCQAKYPYDALNDDELTLREGDLITLISKDGQDRGWWRGELRGRIGVFPDNFVIVLPIIDQNGPDYEYIKAEKKLEKASHKNSSQSSTAEEITAKPQNVASQRKSLELKTTDDHKAPPVPGKKPNVPKKSPSSAGSSSAMANLKQKLVDMVDGQGNSRAANHQLDDAECDFDQVERTAMLPDMRANRVKAPGRRPPSVVYRETEPPTLLNGNADHVQPMSLSETSNDEDEGEKKPKVREWEKHKAPWVEELKLNQAKRTPPLTPGATDHSRLKLTPTSDKGASPSDNDVAESKVKSPFAHDKESSPVDMTKSMSALSSTKQKTTPTSDTTPDKSPTSVALRMKSVNPPISTTPNRPQSIHGVNVTNLSAHMPNSQSPSPSAKPPVAEKLNIDTKLAVASSPRPSIEKKEFVTVRQYSELQERLVQMDTRMQQMFHEMQSTIEELKGKLQVETDMRRLLQAELEKVAQCVTQV